MVKLHDTGYKFLFSHAELVRELLETFAPPGVSELLDYQTLRPEPGSFVTPAMKPREDDIVWSVELGGQRVYLYLLLEFQSSVDHSMPVRMMQYVAALYDHLLRGKHIRLAEQGLPPVLPIVLYNGDARWTDSPEILDLIQTPPAALLPFQPRLRFWLLDEGAFQPEYLDGLQKLMAAIFRMEHNQDIAAVKQAIRYLGEMVARAPAKMRIDRAVMQWMRWRLANKMPGLELPELEDILVKGTEMLETNVDAWRAKAVAEGVLLGLREGRQEGRQEGEANLLARQLHKRFGPLSAEARARLDTADSALLALWAERVLDAASLDEVFAEH